MIDNDLKEAVFPDDGADLEIASINGERYVRDADGCWRFHESGIPVPGARDLTLTERFQPKEVLGRDGEVERVLVAGRDVEEAPDLLGWCLESGTPIKGSDGKLTEVLVAIEEWKERDRIPGKLVDPAHSGTEGEKELAIAERRHREAERDLDRAAKARTDVLRRQDGTLTRQDARVITGLSVGRIQQLIRPQRVTEFEHDVLRLLAAGPRSGRDVRAIASRWTGAPRNFGDVLYRFVQRGWVEHASGELHMTPVGHQLLMEADSAALQQALIEEGSD